MSLTVSDLLNIFSTNMKLIAGQGGLARQISSSGILDYELVPELKDRFHHSNLQNGQFILSSLLYAKDNPFMLSDAIKHLTSKGASGLAIRNVFKLKIPESVLRYADSQNFPIFIIQSIELPFETIIYKIGKHLEQEKEGNHNIEVLNNIYSQYLTGEQIVENALKLNPSFNDQYFFIFCKLDDFSSENQKRQIYENFKNCKLFTYEDFICEYKNGILIIKSNENLQEFHNDVYIENCVNEVFKGEPISNLGISDRHGTLTQFKQALNETLFASAYSVNNNKKYCYYRDLGAYQLIFQYCQKGEFVSFSDNIIKKLEDYDKENNSNLVETLVTYVSCNNRMDKTAEKLSQHVQTIRYRLRKIFSLTDFDHKSYSDMEQLSIACKIHVSRDLLNK